MSLDDYVQRLTTTITQELQGPIEQSLRVLLGEVMERAQHDREQAARGFEEQIAAIRADAEAAASRADAERQSLIEQHAAALAALRDEVTAEVGQAVLLEAKQAARDEQAAAEQALRAELMGERENAEQGLRAEQAAEREAAEQALRAELAREREAAEQALRAELAEQREAAEQALRAQLTSEHEAAEQALRAQLAAEREEAERALRDELTREHEQQLLEVEEAHQRGLAALREEEQGARAAAEAALRSQLGAERESAEQAIRQALASDFDERLEEARAQHAPPVEERLAAALRRLDGAASLTETLSALIEQATAESSRGALFLVSGERVRGWQQAGFDAEVSAIDLPLHEAGPIGLAVQTGGAVSTADHQAAESSLPPWLLPSAGQAAVAAPIVVGDSPVAVLYCEGSRLPAIEILARHAGRCLEVLTFARAAAPAAAPVSVPSADEAVRPSEAGPESDSARQEESARRYARLLISELKLYNESAVEEGREHRDLLARLGPEVERARRLYEEKIPAAVRERASWFDEELVRTLAGGDASTLGQVT